jgi:hypothetical protein
MSRSLVHIRVSEKNNFLHEHEIFEMMKSRQLYQMQFDLKRKLEKRIRAIELAEKVQISTFQSKKNVFLNKMREKIRQKNLRRYSKEIQENNEVHHKDFEQLSDDGNYEQDVTKAEEIHEENVCRSLRSKSLLNILQPENEERSDRPVTSRSVVSLHGKSFPVAKSSGRKQISDKTVVMEATMYPSDFISQLTMANTVSDPENVTSKSQNNVLTKMFPEKDINFNLNDTNCHTPESATFPMINTDVIKSLSTFEMGTLTPDGHLLLTRDDYNKYMGKFERKREKRLHSVRRLSQSLDQKVRDFRIEEE